MHIIYAEKYVSPRERPLTPEEAEVRRIAYAIKVPTSEALDIASRALAPLVESHAPPGAVIVLMPVPSSTNTLIASHSLATEIARHIRGLSRRRDVFIKATVARKHPVESSCFRRRHDQAGLSLEEHVMVRIAGPLTITNTVFYFVDNVATTGTTLEACRQALGFGDGIVYADQGRRTQ
ncbi:MAG: hypothetical protein WCS52_07295 [bacterium]